MSKGYGYNEEMRQKAIALKISDPAITGGKAAQALHVSAAWCTKVWKENRAQITDEIDKKCHLYPASAPRPDWDKNMQYTFSFYQDRARRTQDTEQSAEDKRLHAFAGLMSEAGEIASLIQHRLQDKKQTVDKAALSEEMGDMLWFMAELADAYGLKLGRIAKANIAKLRERYPEGYDPERSINRHEYDKQDT